MKIFDAHTHIHFPAYDSDREEVMARARKQNVAMITVGTQFSTSKSAVDFANANPDVWATVGFHPGHFAEKWHHDKNEQVSGEPEVFDPVALEELARQKKVVAIGECGLDYFRLEGESQAIKSRQKEAFEKQIEIAHAVGKPLMIHCRSAFPDLIDLLSANKGKLNPNSGAIHFFTGTPEEAKKLWDLGFAFTFGGVITFTKDYNETIAMLPLSAILSETDAPYVAPVPYRGKRNEPSYVLETVKHLAELRGISVEEMAETINSNVSRVFPLVS